MTAIQDRGEHLLGDPVAWGRRLIEVGDIDPIYDMLQRALLFSDISSHRQKRWLVAYWCLYHAGAASLISHYNGEEFWDKMAIAAENNHTVEVEGVPVRWPRATERRHWRGKAATNCVATLRQRFPVPELMAEYPADDGSDTLEKVSRRVQEWPSFGPWIAFKVADMLERVVGYDISFPDNVVFYDSPAAGLRESVAVSGANSELELISAMKEEYTDLSPPGRWSRPIGVQELETIFCKWKSARGGHYWIGKDLAEIRHALKGWGSLADVLASKHLS